MSITLNIYLLYWYFQQKAGGPYDRGDAGNCPACP